MEKETKRSQREKEQYNSGLKRETYNNVLSHTSYYYLLRRNKLLKQILKYADGKRVLELGSSTWKAWIDENDIKPARIDCINISEKELELGRELISGSEVQPKFHIMDANNLEFDNESFDVVFGAGILHHLEFDKAMDEVYRVLKPGGIVLFTEPLDINPVGMIVRYMTPMARTIDEKPLRFRELNKLRRTFKSTFYYEQLLSVLFGVLSRNLFTKPNNFLMKGVFFLDRAIDFIFPPLRPFFRHVLIYGKKR